MTAGNRLWLISSAARIGISEYRAHYTWQSWVTGWGLRLVCQVTFFSMIGLALDDATTVRYLAIGNIIAVLTMESAGAMMFIAGERRRGNLPLMVAAPGSHVVALLSRSLNAPLSGLLSSTVVFLVVVPVFDIALPGPSTVLLVPVALACAVSTYCYGACVSAVVMRFPNLNWLAVNISYLTLMAFAGVNVPVSYWPAPVEVLANALPVTHGLTAVRALLDPAGAPTAGQVLAAVGAELLVACGWLAVGAVAMHVLVENARRRGTLSRR